MVLDSYSVPSGNQTGLTCRSGLRLTGPAHQRGRAQHLPSSSPTHPRFFAVPISIWTIPRPLAGSTPHSLAPRLTTALAAAPCLQSAPSARSPPSLPPLAPPVRSLSLPPLPSAPPCVPPHRPSWRSCPACPSVSPSQAAAAVNGSSSSLRRRRRRCVRLFLQAGGTRAALYLQAVARRPRPLPAAELRGVGPILAALL